MSEDDSDFKDTLEGTVEEVKDRIRDMDTPDYEGLLEAEKEGKDRKTVKEFLESRLGDSDSSEEKVEVKDSEDLVEGIEEETEGGILGSFSRTSVLAGGLILGLVVGFAAAGLTGSIGAKANPQQVQENVRTLATAGGFNGTVSISEPTIRHSMYYLNVTLTQQAGNQTVSRSQQVYVTLDGQYMFLVRKQFGQTISPINIPQALQRAQQQQNQPPTGGQTGTPQTNATQ
ncbi:MAG: hypothetical protein ABEJ36_04520 [Candidatus Nanosalina sp.]